MQVEQGSWERKGCASVAPVVLVPGGGGVVHCLLVLGKIRDASEQRKDLN